MFRTHFSETTSNFCLTFSTAKRVPQTGSEIGTTRLVGTKHAYRLQNGFRDETCVVFGILRPDASVLFLHHHRFIRMLIADLPILRIAAIVGVMLLIGGCSPTGAQEKVAQDDQSKAATSSQPPEERWGAIVLGGEKIGHTYEKTEFLSVEKDEFVRTTTIESMEIRRGTNVVSTRVENVFLETTAGKLRQYVTKVDQGGASVQKFQGNVAQDGTTITIQTESGGRSQSETKDWKPEYGGLYASRLGLTNPPLRADQTRSQMILVPTLNQAAEITFTAGQPENVQLLDGSEATLLAVSMNTKIGKGSTLSNQLWIDSSGDVVKMTSPVQQIEIFRCSKEFALSPNQDVRTDLIVQTSVYLDQPIQGLDQATLARYRIRLKNGNPQDIFSAHSNQSIKTLAAQQAELTVFKIRPDSENPIQASGDQPEPSDLASSPIIQVDDPKIQSIAQQIELSGSDWQKATQLERFVSSYISEKDFSKGFLTAAEVASQRAGDCTEHAVLLVALLRSKGIPARGAMGLVYVDSAEKPGFAYHMWTEAWIEDRWIPLDATRAKGGIDVGYLKVTESSFAGSSGFAAFLPVSQVIGQLAIEKVQLEK